MNFFLENIFTTNTFTIEQFTLCIACSLVVGLLIAVFYSIKFENNSQSFVTTIALLPAIVNVVIIVVGNNIGAGIAVAGAFSLVRFRSAPGTAREIGFIFLAMSAGLLVGAGYLGYAILYSAILGVAYNIYRVITRDNDSESNLRILKITIPESLNYIHVFDEVFETYTTYCKNTRVRTTNMGTMFRLTYEIRMKDNSLEKQMLDSLRCLNGNLEVSLTEYQPRYREL